MDWNSIDLNLTGGQTDIFFGNPVKELSPKNIKKPVPLKGQVPSPVLWLEELTQKLCAGMVPWSGRADDFQRPRGETHLPLWHKSMISVNLTMRLLCFLFWWAGVDANLKIYRSHKKGPKNFKACHASVVPRLVNDVSCVTRINHECRFSWQVQYLVMLEDELCCSAHCKCRFTYVRRISHECFSEVLE